MPFELLVDELKPERSLSHGPLFQLFFSVEQDDGNETDSGIDGVDITPIGHQAQSSKFDLALVIGHKAGEPLSVAWTYNTDLFAKTSIERFAARFETLLTGIVETPEQTVNRLPLLGAAEKQALAPFEQIIPLRATATNPADDQIHHRFEAQVRNNPDALAVNGFTTGEQLSYGELNRQANQIAHLLHTKGIGPGDRVAVMLERTPQLVVALLGILKTGAAYVPLDPAYPEARSRFIIEDSQVGALLCTADMSQSDHPLSLCLDEIDTKSLPDSNLNLSELTPDNTAYVIYTSGSTGNPKGVMVAHCNTLALVDWAEEYYPLEALANIGAGTSVCFDLSVFELFVTLTLGTTITLLEDGLESATAEGITLVNTVPSVARALAEKGQLPDTVQVINLCGEPLKQDLADSLVSQWPEVKTLNLYGPSEDTTYSTFAVINQVGKPVTIGLPLPGTRVEVLDSEKQPVGIDMTGELYLSGEGVTQGYWNRAEQTAKVFDNHPDGDPRYRTGDLVRRDAQGILSYIGRADRQLKLRGFRIEPGEIETLFSRQSDVDGAAVQLMDNQLVAWIVCEPGRLDELDQLAQARLPSHMVPGSHGRRNRPAPDR